MKKSRNEKIHRICVHLLLIGFIIPAMNLPVFSGVPSEKQYLFIHPCETYHISGKVTDVARRFFNTITTLPAVMPRDILM